MGGHLSLALGVGVSQAAFADLARDWLPAVASAELAEGRLTRAVAAGTEVVLARRGEEVFALASRCTYRGGNLHDGELRGDAVVCPRDGCTFRLEDGAIVKGPASVPQPSLETRVIDGRVEVRSRRGSRRT